MTVVTGERIGISKQRGFWLRCFLGLSILKGTGFSPYIESATQLGL
jgi:hypothetical protein